MNDGKPMSDETLRSPAPFWPGGRPGRLERDGDFAVVVLDEPGKKVNTLSSRMMAWFEDVLADLEARPPRGVILVSGKPGTFVAGADIEELRELTSQAEVTALLRRGHALTRRLAALPCPTVAAIHGACLGGGLELALACDLRVATDHEKTRLGLPEVQLGLIPGLGGTQRLPRLIGVPAALAIILPGGRVRPAKALKLGLVDDLCHPADLGVAARRLLEGAAAAGRRSGAAKKGLVSRLLSGLVSGLKGGWMERAARTPVLRDVVYAQARKGVLAKTGGRYPAPLVALEVVREGMRLPLDQALEYEAGAFSTLVVSEQAKNLMGIFFLKNEVEARAARRVKDAFGEGAEQRPVEKVGVLGAGFMGAGIAQVLADKGVRVVLKDRDTSSLARGMGQIGGLSAKKARRRSGPPAGGRAVEVSGAMARVTGTTAYPALAGLEMVIEAVFEDLAVKHQVLREVEAVAADDFIFASNTSTLPIAEIAAAASRPENVVGMHFFSPVEKMPLLEVIRHAGTSERALASVVAVGQRMGKTVIVVGDGPGFFTSRVLASFLNEAAWCLADGATIEQIDAAMKRWGWPVGPMTLLDEVGLDIAHHAGDVMRAHLGERFDAPPVVTRMIEDGRKGRKSGRGFYSYGDEGEKSVDGAVYALLDWEWDEVADEEIVDRCWLQMLGETARAMEDGIIENPADVDIGVIFGFGFPPFRGGLLKEADRRGLAWVVERLDALADLRGERLRPAPLLRRMADSGETFYPAPSSGASS